MFGALLYIKTETNNEYTIMEKGFDNIEDAKFEINKFIKMVPNLILFAEIMDLTDNGSESIMIYSNDKWFSNQNLIAKPISMSIN